MPIKNSLILLISTLLIASLTCNAKSVPRAKSTPATNKTIESRSATDIRIGVLAYRGKEKAKQRWQPTIDYLSTQLPQYKFTLSFINLGNVEQQVKSRNIDFILTNTGNYVLLEYRYGISRIATLINRRLDKKTIRFGSVIFTRGDRRDINTLADLKGKSFAAVNRTGFGGFQVAWYELLKQGINPFKDFSRISFTGFPQKKVLYQVLSGEVDAGTFRTDTLERLIADKIIRADEIKVIGVKNHAGFPFKSSTALYPEWPFSKLKHTPREIAHKVAVTLLSIGADSRISLAANNAGWTVPLSYQSVHDLLGKLNEEPYRQIRDIGFIAFLKRYWKATLASILLLVLTSMTAIYILCLNQTLRQTNRELNREIKARTELSEKLQHQVMHDPLTGIYNRHAFNIFIDQEIARSDRLDTTFSVVLIDIDNFKEINDTYGHAMGDHVLKEFGHRLELVMRDSDVLARIGGDEFAAICSNVTETSDTNLLIERFYQVSSEPYTLDDQQCHSHFSCGFSVYSSNTSSESALLKVADNNLYDCKKQKRKSA